MVPRWRSVMFLGLLALLSLPAVYPYLGSDVPRTNDLAAHISRAFELEQLLTAGVLFPRWGPHLAHGYGYPVYNYFPYLTHYLIALIHMITGVDYLWAYRLVFVLVTIATAWGTFMLGRDLFDNELAGLIAATGFVYSPYLLMTAHVRGGLPESLALATLPFVLWTWRGVSRCKVRLIPWGGLAYAAMICSHNGTALQVLPVVLAFALWAGRASLWRTIGYTAVTLFLALALSSFYWFPALTELSFAQIEKGYASSGIIYYENFSTLSGMVTYPSLPVDSDLLNPPTSRPVVPVVALALAVLALVVNVISRRTLLSNRLFYGASAAGCLFLALPHSRFVWDALPLLQRTLWPWRFVGPASLLISLLASSLCLSDITHWVSRTVRSMLPLHPHATRIILGKLGSTVPALLVFPLLMSNGLPWLYPHHEPLAPPRRLADIARSEMPPWIIGTTLTAEYLPKWVSEVPDTSLQLAKLLADPDPDRLDRAELPEGAAVQHTVNDLLRDEYHIEAPAEVRLIFQQFFFPGWQARLDGAPWSVRVTQPHGLIAVDLPSGEHTLSLQFGSTLGRTLAGVVSAVTLIVVIYCVLRSTLTSSSLSAATHFSVVPSLTPVFVLSIVVIGMFLFSVRVDTPLRVHGLARGNKPVGMQHSSGIDFGGELWLHGYSLSENTISANGQAQLDLYWQAQRPLDVSYGFNVRLRDEQGRMWNKSDVVQPVSWRLDPSTDIWPPTSYILDNYVVEPLVGTPPGEYHLDLVAFRQDTLQELELATIGVLEVTTPYGASYIDAAPLAYLGDGQVALLNLAFDRDEAAPGNHLGVHAVWQGQGNEIEYQAHLLLVAANGETLSVFEIPIGENHHVSEWQLGEVVRDQYILRIPPESHAGQYEWYLTATNAAGEHFGEYRTGTTLNITPLVRRFTVPPLTQRLDVTLGERVTLVGYVLQMSGYHAGDALDVTLVWQSEIETHVSYHVFVHLLDENGALIAQSDGEPNHRTRPTTGWLPSEVVVDPHTLQFGADIPAGLYHLWVGLYDPDTGERLVTQTYPDGSVPLGIVEVSVD